MSKVAGPAKKTSSVAEPSGQFTWRVRRKLDGGDTPWKSGGPAEIMEVVLRRLEVLESFEKSTLEIERRIDNLDKNILAVAKTIMPRPPGAPAPPPKADPILAKTQVEAPKQAVQPPAKAVEAPKKVAAGGAAAAAPAPAAAAGPKVGVKKPLKSK